MKKISLLSLAAILVIPSRISLAQQLNPNIQNAHWIGTYKSAKISYGRIYQLQRDTVNAAAMNYMGGIYFWVGAKVFGNQPQVVAADGNHLTGRPEWKPLRWKKLDAPVMEIDAIEDITISEYNDRDSFDGHSPMGVFVRQTVYSFENKPYQVFNFEVTNLGDRGDLTGVYLGIVGHFRIPDIAKKRVIGRNDLLRFIGPQKMPVVMRAGDAPGNAPLIGIVPLSDKKAKLNFWKMEKQYITDPEKYAFMSSEGNRKDATEPGIYNFIWSSGPYDMPRWTTAEFSIALMQAEGQESMLSAKSNSEDVFDTSIKSRHNLAALGKEAARKIPDEYILKQNYPNPFNPTTTIEFSIPNTSHVRLTIYNILGQRVRTLANSPHQAGEYALQWDGRDDAGLPVASGIYIYELHAGEFVMRNKVAFVK